MATTNINVRIDDEIDRALTELTADGRTRSDAIRNAILLAHRQQHLERLQMDAEAAATDPADLAEMRAVMAEMDEIGGW